jgi:hypothetical protein
MSIEAIEREFKKKVCDQLSVVTEGLDRYRVFTPFLFEDGDHLSIVLKKDGHHWFFSDEGHTYMHLTYDINERELRQGTRQKIISNALKSFSLEDRDGELVITVPDEQFGDALYSFVQGLLRISDVSYLNRERTRFTFLEDFRSFISERIPEDRREFDWHEPRQDPEGRYIVDCRLTGAKAPVFLYALSSDERVSAATIILHQLERWGLQFRSVGIYRDQEEVTPLAVARFTDICERQFASLSGNQERIANYLLGLIAA